MKLDMIDDDDSVMMEKDDDEEEEDLEENEEEHVSLLLVKDATTTDRLSDAVAVKREKNEENNTHYQRRLIYYMTTITISVFLFLLIHNNLKRAPVVEENNNNNASSKRDYYGVNTSDDTIHQNYQLNKEITKDKEYAALNFQNHSNNETVQQELTVLPPSQNWTIINAEKNNNTNLDDPQLQLQEEEEPVLIVHPFNNNTSFLDVMSSLTSGIDVEKLYGKPWPNLNVMCDDDDDSTSSQNNNHTSDDDDNSFTIYNFTNPTNNCTLLGNGGGTGNVLHHVMDLRYAALFANNKGRRSTGLIVECGINAISESHNLIQPWLSGYFPPVNSIITNYNTTTGPMGMVIPDSFCPKQSEDDKNHHGRKLSQHLRPMVISLLDVGQKMNNENRRRLLPLRYMIPYIQHDLRRMAVSLVGVPDPHHPSATFEKDVLLPEAQNPPFTPSPTTGAIYRVPINGYYENGPTLTNNIELDEVAIHYRCGDALMGAPGKFYYVKFAEYSKLISPTSRTIGIVTQPFSVGANTRPNDDIGKSGERCKTLVYGLVDHLQSRFPDTKISIRNGPDETLPLAFARMIMANQTLALTPSTFAVFPVVSSFGTGYFPLPTGPQSRVQYNWIGWNRDLYNDAGIELLTFKENISGEKLASMFTEGKVDSLMKWFRNETAEIP